MGCSIKSDCPYNLSLVFSERKKLSLPQFWHWLDDIISLISVASGTATFVKEMIPNISRHLSQGKEEIK